MGGEYSPREGELTSTARLETPGPGQRLVPACPGASGAAYRDRSAGFRVRASRAIIRARPAREKTVRERCAMSAVPDGGFGIWPANLSVSYRETFLRTLTEGFPGRPV